MQETAQQLAEKAVNPGFSFKIGKLIFAPTYIHAAAIVFLLFLLVLTLARVRRMYVDWSFKGAVAMLFLGFMLALVLEGFFIIGGRTALTETLGWKSAPKPIQTALDTGRGKLIDVLGVAEEIPLSEAKENTTLQSVMENYQSLSPEEAASFKQMLCTP